MYCPNCGENLRDTKYNFCPHCGSEISTIFEVPQLRIEREQYPSTPSSQSTMEYSYPQMIQQKVIRKPLGEPGVYSKRCLAFSITSFALTFWYLAYFLIISLILPFSFPPVKLQIIRSIVVLITAGVGLIFGILGQTSSLKAGKLEPKNRLLKVGSVFAIIGIVSNSINIAQTLFTLIINILI